MDINIIKGKLQKEGYKLTTQRRAILNTIVDNYEEHLSCDEIYNIVKKKYPDLGIATVYRTLQLFEKLNIVYKLNFDDGCSRYELSTDSENHHHHHLVCLNCGKVTEVKLDLLEALEEEIESEGQFTIVDHNVKFYGYCSECKK
ncbi:Fur family transcriptional regulator, ferric uptake regulator [Tissierella praeacuta DSM 18095]|uniref:Fur family transcriptional regulator, ferric uptake regulator n=1 Tax=Tissierella praeacuta DSM 18095 TaxID=1123404 RepID=A0A1M4SAX1_9FIRM|nr:Fur family transcriptional regulator [Tissierella praeacuta]TCU72927.1 Fur family ferric uptake transcriptional regulator [Tissierella praeacuta]SHE29341.1 Fur family transcriptional regulator, ferric uptake regulator [Tissierella praeacuta DSM 18095]SUP01218.1 Ferric uptake regulation protein [Tissierella praeacuta]